MKSPAARVAIPTTPMLTPIPMPILSPVLRARSSLAEGVVDAVAVHLGLPVSSAKTQPFIWTANMVEVVLVVSVAASHCVPSLVV